MKTYKLDMTDTAAFVNNSAFCVGTGRMGLALRHEYHEQLAKVQKDIGFSYIRGHGLFCDDMAIYQTYTEDGQDAAGGAGGAAQNVLEEYNFRYVDMVFDDYLSLKIKPFVELGFMPEKMASGEQTIFYWKGNVTPPVDYDRWARLVTATVKHWIDRYGRDEVITWPFEVWNEPNLHGFWKDADMEEYFKLYDVSAAAVKSCDRRIRIGGPAICGVDDERWLRCFLEHCRDNDVPLDFVTRHAYGTEMPERDGHYVYQKLRDIQGFMSEPENSRAIIDSYPQFKGMEMHVTEFNTSYSPENPIHDTNLNAAYIARLLSVFGDSCASYSYWTFGDVFEESGVAFTPFSGCFGLLANGGIPKPTYWTYVFYKQLFTSAIAKNEHFIVTVNKGENDGADGIGTTGRENEACTEGTSKAGTTPILPVPKLRAIAWNPVFEKGGTGSLPLDISVSGLDDGAYMLLIKTVDETTCNPLKTWLDMGSPAYPSTQQLELIKECAVPQVTTKRLDVSGSTAAIDLLLTPNAVCFFELQKITPETDRGFHRERIK